MVSKQISWSGIGLRFLFAAILVFTTYNPHASYIQMFNEALFTEAGNFSVGLGFMGIVLLIGWVIFIRATVNSLGMLGFILACAFFTSFFWLLLSWGIIDTASTTTLTYMILIGTSCILTVGLSWSHIRRRLTGQIDVDDMEHE